MLFIPIVRVKTPLFEANANSFSSASLIKVPILLAWAELEQAGEINLDEVCELDAEPQVKGAGFARCMTPGGSRTRMCC